MKLNAYIKTKVKFSILISLTLLFTLSVLYNNHILITNHSNLINDKAKNNLLETSSTNVNGKPLLIHQYSTITSSFFPSSLPANISFTLYEGWSSQNVNINYEGVSQKSERVFNSGFDTDTSGWGYKSNNPTEFINNGYQSDDGNPVGCTEIRLDTGIKNKGNYGYYEQNISIPEKLSSGLISRLAIDYKLYTLLTIPTSLSVYLAIIIGNVEKNVTYSFETYVEKNTWLPLSMIYDPSDYGQVTPNNATVRVGIYTNAQVMLTQWCEMRFDNIRFELWTMPNESNLVRVFDNDIGNNYSYINSSYGKGYTFIDGERNYESTKDLIFTIYSNKTEILDFFIYNITIQSSVVRTFNSSISEIEGCICTFGDNILWETSIEYSEYYKYGEIWAEIIKPTDWNIIHLYDRDNVDRVGNCLDLGIGSNKTTIPIGTMTPSNIERPWKIVASSENYILKANMASWNGSTYLEESKITFGDIFQINVTLNNSISILGSTLNCTINYPNGTIYWNQTKIISNYNIQFGNLMVGNNMTIGTYQVAIEWEINQSYFYNDKVGFKTFNFIVWHHTNLTALNPYIESLSGDPLLIKVKFLDYDFNSTISFAEVNYSSNFGSLGPMIYIGSGIYFAEIDTSSLELGDYYFSVSARNQYFENLTIYNLIHLKIVPEPLALDLSRRVIQADANSIASCQLSVIGAISKIRLSPANLSTNWFNPYNVTLQPNGTYILDFSTENIPPHGYLESYTIEIYANKTNYGETADYLTLLVYPIPTIARTNASLYAVYQNDIIKVKANYTKEVSNELIGGANCTIEWQGAYFITPILNEYEITLYTSGLAVDYYTVLITFNRAGYETAFRSITIVIKEKEVNISVSINSIEIDENSIIELFFQQQLNISARVSTIIGGIYLSGGQLTFLSNNFEENLTESPLTYFTKLITIDGAYFDAGINNIFLSFQQANYSTKIFTFQLYIRAQPIELSVQIDNQDIPENYLLEIFYNQQFHLSCRAFATVDAIFLSGGTITFINSEYEIELTETAESWFNETIIISKEYFTIGPNNVYLRFQQSNYTTVLFSFQILVNQIEINVDIPDFEGFLRATPGDSVIIKLNLTEVGSSAYVENATVFYSCFLGRGYFNYLGNGLYEKKLNIPAGIEGKYNFEVVISKSGGLYRTKEFSFFLEIVPEEGPNTFMMFIIIGLIVIIGILGTLSLRSYVIIPKRRAREAELLSKIQVYKDVWNIRAVVIIHKESGLPVYSEEISIMEKEEDSFLISGFIQAITAFSETFIEKEFRAYSKLTTDYEYLRTIIDLDFKFFQLVVCDYETVRTLVVLREEASDRLKEQLYLLTKSIDTQFNEEFRNFKGSLNHLNKQLYELINQFLFLHYNNSFELTSNRNYLDSKIESGELTKLEKRLINVITSMTKIKKEFTLRGAIELIHEKNEDLVLEAINTLISQKIILSPSSPKIDHKKK
ncbi:MAG: hypothetical protein ACFE96_02120 [Candidatus Hermodarchaeota archaeon]